MPAIAPPILAAQSALSYYKMKASQSTKGASGKIEKKSKKNINVGGIKKMLSSKSIKTAAYNLKQLKTTSGTTDSVILNGTNSATKLTKIVPAGVPHLAKPDSTKNKKLKRKKSSATLITNGTELSVNQSKETSLKTELNGNPEAGSSNSKLKPKVQLAKPVSSVLNDSSLPVSTTLANFKFTENQTKVQKKITSSISLPKILKIKTLSKESPKSANDTETIEVKDIASVNKDEVAKKVVHAITEKLVKKAVKVSNEEGNSTSVNGSAEKVTKTRVDTTAKQEEKKFDNEAKSKVGNTVKMEKMKTGASSKETKKVKKTKKVKNDSNKTKSIKKEVVLEIDVLKKRKVPSDSLIDGTKKRKLHASKVSLKSSVSPLNKVLREVSLIMDTRQRGECILNYILSPYDTKEFFKTYSERKILHIQRNKSCYYDGIFSTKIFDHILRHDHVEYTKNIDVTSYTDGKKESHNPEGRVYPPVIWDYYSNGCSIRFLNPQTFHKPVWQILTFMQDFMGSFCGANTYLTPENTQGFAPHWDDIEAFVLQLEGKKRWRVYSPRKPGEVLPRYSSGNFSQDEIGEPILDAILQEGDMLYMPRGFIHQGEAVQGSHSLHITISTYQKNTWADLMEKMFSTDSLARAAANNCSLREGLPLGIMQYAGASAASAIASHNSTTGSSTGNERKVTKQLRKQLKDKLVKLVTETLLNDSAMDRAVDEMAKKFLRVALPPYHVQDEQLRTVIGDGEHWLDGGVKGRVEMEPDSMIRLVGAHVMRVLPEHDEDGKLEVRVYYSVENSREYEGRPEQFLVVEGTSLAALHHLIEVYPHYTSVEDLPLTHLDEKLTLAMALWERNLLITEEPLSPVDDCLDTDEE